MINSTREWDWMDKTKQSKLDNTYIRMADVWGQLSHSNRAKVGALIVKDQMIISDGYNGTPTGFDNCCEINYTMDDGTESYETKWEVLHAEANAILKCAKHGTSLKGGTLYLTMSPCKNCAKLIFQAGITRVVYRDEYRDREGVIFLQQAGIDISNIILNNLDKS